MSDQALPREWHGGTLPPGTPAPSSSPVSVVCRSCEHVTHTTLHRDLGTVELQHPECSNCGEEFPEDAHLEYGEPDDELAQHHPDG